MRPLAVLIGAVMLFGLSGCGNDDGSVSIEPPGTTTEPGVTTTEAGDPVEPVGDFSTEPKDSSEYATNEVALLSDVRIAQHDGFTRVVFEFRGEEPPGWIAEYQEPPVTEDPSGRTIAVEGDAFLRVTMSAASAVDLRGEEPVVSFGPDRVAGPEELVNEVVDVGDFEAVMTWVIGLESEAPFAVATFTEPSRVVVDIER